MDFLKFCLSLDVCHSHINSTNDIRAENADESENNGGSEIPTSTEASLLKDLLGDELYTSLIDYFQVPPEDVDYESFNDEIQVSDVVRETTETCNSLASVELFFSKGHIAVLCVTLALIVFVSVLWITSRKKWLPTLNILKLKTSEKLEKSKSLSLPINSFTQDAESVTAVSTIGAAVITDIPSIVQTENKNSNLKTVKLHYVPQCTTKSRYLENDISNFLEETTHRLFSKLDRLLLKNPAGVDQTQSAISSPRLARRPLPRRQRIGSSPSLQLPEASTSNGDTKNREKTVSWEQLKQFSSQLGLKPQKTLSVYQEGLDRSSLKLTHYFQRVCPVKRDVWKATHLVISYILYVMKSELENIRGKVSVAPYQFVKFDSSGAMKRGTNVTRLNAFDVLMHTRPTVNAREVLYDLDECSRVNIPPGQVVLLTDKNATVDSKLKSYMKMDGQKYECLSSKQFLKEAGDIIDECLNSLYSQTSTAMDRLPFQIRRAPVDSLQLVINTRALVGLGETELKINILPVLPLITEGIFQSPVLYASPVPDSYDISTRSDRGSMCNPEVLWQLMYNEFESAFLDGIERFMSAGNVNSCHYMCLMILKAVLTGSSKNSLLDRGVLPECHINAVLSFLLLESVPEQWTYDKLSDRFSDVIHFIRESYANGRLPNLFLGNPHLTKKMPSVSGNALLGSKKQQNLLKDSSQEGLDKCLEYLKDRLREVGLTDCVKEEYSCDMWEYEFFLFS